MPQRAPSAVSLETAERQFDRIQAFFPRIDSKVSSIFAIASGEIAVVSFISLKNLHKWWMLAPACCSSLPSDGPSTISTGARSRI